jgi:hypothetical protein
MFSVMTDVSNRGSRNVFPVCACCFDLCGGIQWKLHAILIYLEASSGNCWILCKNETNLLAQFTSV